MMKQGMTGISIRQPQTRPRLGWGLALCAGLVGLPACAQAQSTDTGTLVTTGVPDAC
jgi:hypothetical protein